MLAEPYISRVQLAQRTNLSSTTISNLVNELLQKDLVVEEGAEVPTSRRGVGRPRTRLRLVPEARHVIGVHIGVPHTRVALADLRANLSSVRTLSHAPDRLPRETLATVADLVQQVLAQARIPPERLLGVGVGASGLIDRETGVNVLAPNLSWRAVPLQQWLSEWLDLPITVDNNVRSMALGEAMFGAGRPARVLAFVYGRVGVGAGIVVDGKLYRGSSAGAGEIGHTTIIADGGTPCRCGNRGCLETLVSEPSIVQQAQHLAVQQADGRLAAHVRQGTDIALEQILDAARKGDPTCRALLSQTARYLGIALANLVNVLNPEMIVLGGLFAQAQDLMLPEIESTTHQRAFADLGRQVEIRPATFGRQAGLVGAAALALHDFFYG
jgi:glucokinase-like ROK family protein